ncbi:hypothetical protein SAMN05444365_10883 [Micromonospora pattaloongensis]|uniref:Uncharacterized protein n=1 Tax=Micromonospora pattaloongensis TaxID=405436 RepID=A0A1H3RLB7_9ACTN|nr:DUF6703 family protein [Micromonospora pattaloongensis]SDZ25699.1 hypothetical protein SAMN05444365_10883 [Micromonospora pattaloongensis]
MQPTQNGPLSRFGRVNPTAAFLGTLALVLAGLFAPGIIGGALLLVLAGAVAALLVATWSAHPPRARLPRVLVLTVLVTAALVKIL